MADAGHDPRRLACVIEVALAQRDGIDLDRVQMLAELIVHFAREVASLVLLHADGREREVAILRQRVPQSLLDARATRDLGARFAHAPPRVPGERAREEQYDARQLVDLVALVRLRKREQSLGEFETNAQQGEHRHTRGDDEQVAPWMDQRIGRGQGRLQRVGLTSHSRIAGSFTGNDSRRIREPGCPRRAAPM